VVKVFYLLRRRPDVSAEEFHRYWRQVHGPLFWETSAARNRVVRYEQHHTAPTTFLAGTDAIDGISVFWFESMEDLQALYADQEFLTSVVPDGARFIDQSSIRRIITDAEDVFGNDAGASL